MSGTHRGPDPRDADAFAPDRLTALRAAVGDLSWLLGRGYAETSALKIVGDRHRLTERQRMAARRCACGDDALAARRARRASTTDLRGASILIDGFNVLTTVEAALGGAPVLLGRDGAARDVMGVHGTYRRVEETIPAVRAVGRFLAHAGVAEARWLLDRPVSNSGRLRAILLAEAEAADWRWSADLEMSPDPVLAASVSIVATADAGILDRAVRWFPLARAVIEVEVPGAWTVPLGDGP